MMSDRKRPNLDDGVDAYKRPKLSVESVHQPSRSSQLLTNVGSNNSGSDESSGPAGSSRPDTPNDDWKNAPRLGRDAASTQSPALPRGPGGAVDFNALKNLVEMRRKTLLAAKAPAQPPAAPAALDMTPPEDIRNNLYYDPSLGVPGKRRRARATLNFVPAGKYAAQAEKMRMTARIAEAKARVQQAMKRAGVGTGLDLLSAPDDDAVRRPAPPLVEWWDVPLTVGYRTYEDMLGDADHDDLREFTFADPVPMAVVSDAGAAGSNTAKELVPPITQYVHHPVPLPPPFAAPAVPRQVMLTKKEQKKLRRQRREEEQREKVDKIRLGLLPPDPPKVRLANMMRVLQNESVQDPTLLAAKVKAEVEARKRLHEETNQARALTPEQKREKKARKMQRDEAKGLHVAIFKCRDLAHPKARFKVVTNAQQLGLTGCAALHRNELHVVVVEGGPRAVRHFKKLMLRRIKWASLDAENGEDAAMGDNDEDDDEDETYVDPNKQHCWLIWEGTVPQRNFQEFRCKGCPVEKMAIDMFANAGVQEYWDLAKAWMPPRIN
ncbi:hypothetical protein AMAG_09332 [Allomyces macrogynus ATCC 38327]|uniref:Uncharacterized protein n=1 Tax=Allomyces macrogynus (strain ATCC 38327) TaxID=578462 RepID=A0A0L0SP70_ALLM3|nr:hypothetical protein AMAG_09332 [Allomyces macrogynus ATCC 38327]|eukprot:KNE64303.1 hypothetical protein AMAG_09332 [Allomyces macrogynus ATCC 38327]